jgi:hypothetical protein
MQRAKEEMSQTTTPTQGTTTEQDPRPPLLSRTWRHLSHDPIATVVITLVGLVFVGTIVVVAMSWVGGSMTAPSCPTLSLYANSTPGSYSATVALPVAATTVGICSGQPVTSRGLPAGTTISSFIDKGHSMVLFLSKPALTAHFLITALPYTPPAPAGYMY